MPQQPHQPSVDPEAENRQKDTQALEHLDVLLLDEHFRWYCENILEKARKKYHDEALNTGASPEQRDHACWQHAAVNTLCGEAERMQRECDRRLLGSSRIK